MQVEPRKRFGQHFLIDGNIIDRIVSFLAPNKADYLVEIGPGTGALTFRVLPLVNELTVIEFDRDLIPILQKKASHLSCQLTILSKDVLSVNFAELINDNRLLRVFGNLPYNISTPLIFHLLSFHDVIFDMTFMLQKEVAERICAKPGNKNYGRLSVMVQYHADAFLGFSVSPDAFQPPPQVMSQMIKLIPRKEKTERAQDEILFAELVKSAFSMRRKTLRNSLKNYITGISLESLPFALSKRAEELSVNDFVKLANLISMSKQK